MKVGIIGTGNMGTILTQSIIEGRAVPPSDVTVTNRTLRKAYQLQSGYHDIHVAENAEEVVQRSELIFVCIKPLDIHPLLMRITDHLNKEKILASITSPITVEQIESVVDCPVARIIPSITNRALSGTTLITFGNTCQNNVQGKLLNFVKNFSKPVEIEENVTRAASDLCSCGPAFVSYLLERMIQAAVSETKISEEQATILTSEMVVGFGRLLEKDIYTFDSLRKKVNVKGGVTGEGLSVLENEIGDVFEKLFRRTHRKFNNDHEHVDKQFEAYTK